MAEAFIDSESTERLNGEPSPFPVPKSRSNNMMVVYEKLEPTAVHNARQGAGKIYRRYVVPNMGVSLALLSQFFNSLMILFCKLLLMDEDFDEPLHPFQVLFVRMSITYIFCAIYFLTYERNAGFPLGPKNYRWLIFLRGLGGTISVVCQYFSLIWLTVSDTIVISFLAPTVTSLMAWMILRERFTRAEALGGLMAFIGVLFIARPGFLSGSGTDSTTAGTDEGATAFKGGSSSLRGSSRTLETSDPKMRFFASMLCLFGTFGTGIAMCAIRKVGFHAHALLMVSYFSLVACVVSVIGITVTPGVTFQMPKTSRQWELMAALGVAGFVMQYLLTAGMQREKASRAIAMCYSQLIYASFFDLLIFEHVPTKLSFLGETIIMMAVGGILYFKEEPAQPPDEEVTVGFRDGGYRDSNEGDAIALETIDENDFDPEHL